MPCAFCGIVPTQLPHLCLLDQRRTHEAALAEFAQREAEWDAERSEYRRQISRLLGRLSLAEQRFSSSEGRIAALEAAQVKPVG